MSATTPTTITALDAFALNVPLLAPFTIATTRLERVENLAIRIRLAGGAEGWGEVPSLQPVTAEDQASALNAIEWLRPGLVGRDAAAWRSLAADLPLWLGDHHATEAAVEMALFDALTRHWGVPLYQFLGGASDTVTTDITIPICPPEEAAALAARYASEGFTTIKTKVGIDPDADLAMLKAIRSAHPDCALVLDANEGFDADEALRFLAALRAEGIEPALFEQPVPRDDWDGLGRVTREAGVPVAADESCRSPEDALRIERDGLATVLNIKLAKAGIVAGLEIAAIAKAAGLGLMIGGMVETRLAMGVGAHFAAGVGGFDWIDLDTPFLLAADPIEGGYVASGPNYSLSSTISGHGAVVSTPVAVM
jgi:L-alanine-DL-glutamate epimerase-like enolase superfamily enzyme